jgi:hypothetical protein
MPEVMKRAFSFKPLKNIIYLSDWILGEETGRLIYEQYFTIVCS